MRYLTTNGSTDSSHQHAYMKTLGGRGVLSRPRYEPGARMDEGDGAYNATHIVQTCPCLIDCGASQGEIGERSCLMI